GKNRRMERYDDRGGTAGDLRTHGQETARRHAAAVRGRVRLAALAAAVRFHGAARPLGRAPAPQGRRHCARFHGRPRLIRRKTASMNDKTPETALSSDATEVRAQKLKILREQIG